MVTSESPYLYRILSFSNLVDLFETRSLYFSSPAAWPDPFEKTFQHRHSNNVFGQCWCKKAVSDAMWRIYSPDGTAVRVRTTRSKLCSALDSGAKTGCMRYFTNDVEYLTASKVTAKFLRLKKSLQANFDLNTAVQSLFVKRDAFDHEAEVRVVIDADEEVVVTKNDRRHIRLSVDPHSLVDSIMFDPRADEGYIKVCAYYLSNAVRFQGRVGTSQLYRVRQGIVAE